MAHVQVYLVDGTYELFRHFYGMPEDQRQRSRLGAARGVVETVLGHLGDGVTHIGVATDHVIESFRNDLWPSYKSSEGMDPQILAQFGPLVTAGPLGHSNKESMIGRKAVARLEILRFGRVFPGQIREVPIERGGDHRVARRK